MTFKSLLDRLFPNRGSAEDPAFENPWIVMGLGNPGPDYRDTRHNAGHWCVQRLVEETGATLENRRLVRLGQVRIDGHGTVLALSRTYVNLSGEAAEYLLTRYRADPERLIVVSDDINLRVGAVRIRKQGSAGGHKGLKSITAAIGTDKYKRVRIGVGKPASPDRQIEHVLGVPGPGERAIVDESITRAVQAIRAIVSEGVEHSMNRFNSMAPAEGVISACGPGDQPAN